MAATSDGSLRDVTNNKGSTQTEEQTSAGNKDSMESNSNAGASPSKATKPGIGTIDNTQTGKGSIQADKPEDNAAVVPTNKSHMPTATVGGSGKDESDNKASTNGSTSNVASENKSAELSETEAKKAADEKAAAEKAAAEKNWNTIDEDRKQLEKDAIAALEKQKSLFAREIQRISQIAKPQQFYEKLSLPRNKTHFDALLDEVQWMANDFVEERKWKIALAKKIAREAVNYVEEMCSKKRGDIHAGQVVTAKEMLRYS